MFQRNISLVGTLPPIDQNDLCRKCGSRNLELRQAARKAGAVTLLTGLPFLLLRKNAYEAGKAAVRNSHKYAPYRTKILRLMGLYYWLIEKQDKAVKWWRRAIEEGKRLNARPDLARTYMEIGKRFLEEKSKYKELNGIKVDKYVDMAKEMFVEMDLQWDLDELEKLN